MSTFFPLNMSLGSSIGCTRHNCRSVCCSQGQRQQTQHPMIINTTVAMEKLRSTLFHWVPYPHWLTCTIMACIVSCSIANAGVCMVIGRQNVRELLKPWSTSKTVIWLCIKQLHKTHQPIFCLWAEEITKRNWFMRAAINTVNKFDDFICLTTKLNHC